MSILTCPNCLRYQFTGKFDIKLSDKCCYKLKKENAIKWEQENNRHITLTGMRGEEGGMRALNGCTIFEGDKLKKFHPLKVCSNEWEKWFIETYNIKLCKLYYPPFNFKRTGCKGCPYAQDIQEELNKMKKLLPDEYKQCLIIWKPIYDEYVKIGYRLPKDFYNKPIKYDIFDFLEGGEK